MIKPELIELVNELKPGEITTLDDAFRLSIEKWIRIRDAWKDGREILVENYLDCEESCTESSLCFPAWDEWWNISNALRHEETKQALVPLANQLIRRIALEHIKVKHPWEPNPGFEKNEERLKLKNGYFFIVTYSGFVHLSNIYDNETLHGSIIEWKYSSKSTAKRGVARMILNSQKFLTNGKKVLDIMDGVLKQQKPFSLYSDSDRSTANKSKKRIYNAMQLLG